MSLAAAFLSKSELEESAGKIGSGLAVKSNVIQQLWILASYVDLCRTNSVNPRIYSLP